MVFRLDADSRTGGGHAVRCLAIAAVMKETGWRCSFVVNERARTIVPALENEDCVVLPGDGAQPGALRNAWPDGCSIMLVDHYGWARTEETDFRSWAKHIVVLDDLADRPHDCDLLIDPSPGRLPGDYDGLLPSSAIAITGAAFAPLRADFYGAGAHLPVRRDGGRILIMFGATDPDNWTGGVLAALADRHIPPNTEIEVILGSAAPHMRDVAEALERLPVPGHLHVQPGNLPALMMSADVAIGAAGGGSLERCCLGLPTAIIAIVDNQRQQAAALADCGAAILAADAPGAVDAALALLEDRSRRLAIGKAATQVCDGLGARRISAALQLGLLHQVPLWLRPAVSGDREILLAWQSESSTRKYARNSDIPTPAEHAAWLGRRLSDPNCIFHIVMRGTEPVGSVRCDRIDADDGWEISINIASAHQGHGVARAALAMQRLIVPEGRFMAFVKRENAASTALFHGAGYVPSTGPGWWELSCRG